MRTKYCKNDFDSTHQDKQSYYLEADGDWIVNNGDTPMRTILEGAGWNHNELVPRHVISVKPALRAVNCSPALGFLCTTNWHEVTDGFVKDRRCVVPGSPMYQAVVSVNWRWRANYNDYITYMLYLYIDDYGNSRWQIDELQEMTYCNPRGFSRPLGDWYQNPVAAAGAYVTPDLVPFWNFPVMRSYRTYSNSTGFAFLPFETASTSTRTVEVTTLPPARAICAWDPWQWTKRTWAAVGVGGVGLIVAVILPSALLHASVRRARIVAKDRRNKKVSRRLAL
jgi:hypothetical protein